MANVPYTPVPTVSPTAHAQSRYQVSVSEANFGGDVGRALSSLGGTLRQSGDELFTRGLAMQELYNRSEAQNADALYMETVGKLHAEYNALQGKNAVDAYPGYVDSIKKAQADIREGLSNDTSRRLFDASSKGTMGRTIFNGAGYAASQNKAYANSASQARVAAIGNQTLSTPEDERSFFAGLDVTEREVRAQGQLNGLAPEAIEEAVSMQKSALWGQRIKGLARQQPIVAGKMLDDGIKRGDIRGEDIGKLTNVVQQARSTVGARMIAREVNSGVGWGEREVDLPQAQEAIGTFESGGRYNLRGKQVTDKSGNVGTALGKYQVMSYNLSPWLAEAGMPSMTEEEFLRSPSAQDQLFNFKFGGYMKKFGSFNAAATAWFAGEGSVGRDGTTVKDVHGTNVPVYIAATNAILARNAPLAQKIAKGEELAGKQAPDDPLFPEYVSMRIKSDHDRNIAAKRDTEFQNRQVVETALMGGESGQLPTTVEELTAAPGAQDAWEQLLPSTQRRYLGILARNAKGDTAWTDTSLREYQRVKGMAQADPADFIDLDVVSMDLPNSAKRELINLQGRVKTKAEGDPRATRAMNILAPDLAAAGIERKNKDEYYQFTGALADQLQQFAEENKRPPKTDEIKLIGSRLLTQQKQPWMFGMLTSKVPTFSVPVPSEEAEKIKASPEWARLGITPTDQQIQRIYTRDLYKKLYGGTTSKSEAAPSPNVPVSQ
jgi:hypothetical protein